MTDLFAFDGATYEPKRDYVRLKGQLLRVHDVMLDGAWHTLADIELALHRWGFPASQAAISARIRDLRKLKFGGHTVERERAGGGLHRYRLKTNSAPVSAVSPNAGSLETGPGRARSLP